MKNKMIGRAVSAVTAAVLCAGMVSGMMFSSFAAEEGDLSLYASTDYANRTDLFDELMAANEGNSTVTVPYPEQYVEGVTERVKYIVNGQVIAEKYSDRTFVMQFCGVDLTFDGSFLAKIGGERIEIQVEKTEPIILQYTCPKCESTAKPEGGTYTAYEGTLDKFQSAGDDKYICPRCSSEFSLSECGDPVHMEVVKGGIQIIEDDKHPVVGGYVYELNVYSDNRAIEDYGTDDSGVKATIKLGTEAIAAAKNEDSSVKFNVYAYLGQSKVYENMAGTVDESNGTAQFRVVDRGWFFLAADKPGDVVLSQGQMLTKALPFIIIGAVVVIAIVVVVIVLVTKSSKKKAAAQ